MATLTFWYHPQGEDNNGNFGPGGPRNTPGWISVTVPDTGDGHKDSEAAIALFPKTVQKRMKQSLQKYNREYPQEPASCVREFIEFTCGWGVPWTLCCENWDEMDGLL